MEFIEGNENPKIERLFPSAHLAGRAARLGIIFLFTLISYIPSSY